MIRLLQLMQLSDSAVPIGGAAHSFGLEGLVECGAVEANSLELLLHGFLHEQGLLEASYCRAAYAAGEQRENVEGLGRMLSAQKPARESREASVVLGRRLLGLCSQVLSEENADALAAAFHKADTHHVIVFGYVGALIGFDVDQTVAAFLQQAVAALDAARLNLERTRVLSPVDGYVTNLETFRGDYAILGTSKLAVVDANSFWVYGYFEETKLPHVKVGNQAQIRMMSGDLLQGHVESISRGIYDRDNPQSRELLADVNPTFNWVRLAQRVPVRIKIDHVPHGVVLSAGTTCSVVIAPR